jgi:hypothetical protein
VLAHGQYMSVGVCFGDKGLGHRRRREKNIGPDPRYCWSSRKTRTAPLSSRNAPDREASERERQPL